MRAERPIPLAPGRRPDVGGRLFGRHCRRGVCTTSPDMRTLPDPVSLDSGSTGRGHRHSLVRRHHLHPNRRGLALRCHRDRHCLPPRRRAGPPATKLYTSLLADALTVACHQRQPQGTVVFHFDRGSQNTSHVGAGPAVTRNFRLSVERTGVAGTTPWLNLSPRPQERAGQPVQMAQPLRRTKRDLRLHRRPVDHLTMAPTAMTARVIQARVRHGPAGKVGQSNALKGVRVRNRLKSDGQNGGLGRRSPNTQGMKSRRV